MQAKRARYADAELARSREGAQYAGEPDPYRKPAEDDEDEEDADGVASAGTPAPGTADDHAEDSPAPSRSAP